MSDTSDKTDVLERVFQLDARGTTVRTEIMAGVTTFMAMAYIVFVNPQVLSETGMDQGAIFTATCLAAAFGTLIMGLWAKFPIAQAPGMGLNAFFAFTVVLGMGVAWQTALAGTLVSGVLFAILSISGAREAVINAIPQQMKLAVAAGIGLFIAFIGLKNAGLVVEDPATAVSLGDLSMPTTQLAIFGVVVTAALCVRGIRGGIFYGMVITAIAGMVAGIVEMPSGIVGAVPSLAPTFGQAITHLPELLTAQMIVVVFTMLFVDLFDTTGTIIGVATQANLLDENDRLPRANRALLSDSAATIGGAVLGTSTTTSYIESAAGVGVGGRTGLTSVTTGFMFLVALLFSPLLAVVTSEVTAPALIVVGMLMAKGLGQIEWDQWEYSLPAFITVIAMPLSYSIANGIALGLALYPLMMVFKGRARDVHPIMYGLLVVFAVYFIWLVE